MRRRHRTQLGERAAPTRRRREALRLRRQRHRRAPPRGGRIRLGGGLRPGDGLGGLAVGGLGRCGLVRVRRAPKGAKVARRPPLGPRRVLLLLLLLCFPRRRLVDPGRGRTSSSNSSRSAAATEQLHLTRARAAGRGQRRLAALCAGAGWRAKQAGGGDELREPLGHRVVRGRAVVLLGERRRRRRRLAAGARPRRVRHHLRDPRGQRAAAAAAHREAGIRRHQRQLRIRARRQLGARRRRCRRRLRRARRPALHRGAGVGAGCAAEHRGGPDRVHLDAHLRRRERRRLLLRVAVRRIRVRTVRLRRRRHAVHHRRRQRRLAIGVEQRLDAVARARRLSEQPRDRHKRGQRAELPAERVVGRRLVAHLLAHERREVGVQVERRPRRAARELRQRGLLPGRLPLAAHVRGTLLAALLLLLLPEAGQPPAELRERRGRRLLLQHHVRVRRLRAAVHQQADVRHALGRVVAVVHARAAEHVDQAERELAVRVGLQLLALLLRHRSHLRRRELVALQL